MTKNTAAILLNINCLAALTLAFAESAAAQTPSSTTTYDVIQLFVVPQIDTMLADSGGELEWGDEPRITVGPAHSDSPFNGDVALHLNLKAHESIVGIGVNANVTVDFRVFAQCQAGHVNVFLNGADVDTDLPQWVEDLAGVEAPQAGLQGFLEMANQLFAGTTCGDVRAWSEGLVVFPADTLEPYKASPDASQCLDSTTGRSGQVAIEGNTIFAQIHPGVDTRWPDPRFGVELHVWVSQDGTDATARELDQTRVIGSAGEDQRMIENVGGEGLTASFELPAGMAFVGCAIEGSLSRSFAP